MQQSLQAAGFLRSNAAGAHVGVEPRPKMVLLV